MIDWYTSMLKENIFLNENNRAQLNGRKILPWFTWYQVPTPAFI